MLLILDFMNPFWPLFESRYLEPTWARCGYCESRLIGLDETCLGNQASQAVVASSGKTSYETCGITSIRGFFQVALEVTGTKTRSFGFFGVPHPLGWP